MSVAARRGEEGRLNSADGKIATSGSIGVTFLEGLRDGSNTLRSFFGTNILTIAWTFAVLGAVLGPIVATVSAFIVYRATISLIRVKQSLPNHHLIVSYGGVVSTVASWKGQAVVDFLVGFTQFTACVSYAAFCSENLSCLSGIDVVYCVLMLTGLDMVISFFHNPYMLAKISVFTNTMMFTGILVILTTIDLHSKDDVDYFLWAGLPVGAATLSSAFGGITTVLDVERTMTHRPGRYVKFLKVVLPCTVVFLSVIGVMGYLTYGANTDAVLSLSIRKGSWQSYVAQTVLFIGPCFEGVLNSFPLFVITEKYGKKIPPLGKFADRYPKPYFYSHRVFWFIIIGLLAHGVPFVGYLASVNGAVGYSSLSFIVPVAVEYLRTKKTSFEVPTQLEDALEDNGDDEEDDVARGGEGADDESVHINYESTTKNSSKNSNYGTDAAAAVNNSDEKEDALVVREAKNSVLDEPGVSHLSSTGNKRVSTSGASGSSRKKTVIMATEPYTISTKVKVELALIFFYGLVIVVMGTVFAVKDIVHSIENPSNSTKC